MAQNLPKPAPLSDSGLVEARNNRVVFVNPPGHEHYARIHSYGKSYDTFGEFDRNKLPEPFRKQRKDRWGTQDGNTGMAFTGRPLK
jgi:hypothetical protein